MHLLLIVAMYTCGRVYMYTCIHVDLYTCGRVYMYSQGSTSAVPTFTYLIVSYNASPLTMKDAPGVPTMRDPASCQQSWRETGSLSRKEHHEKTYGILQTA